MERTIYANSLISLDPGVRDFEEDLCYILNSAKSVNFLKNS